MPPTHNDYTVAWICALPLEMAAAKAMLDEVHDSLPLPINDDRNVYVSGTINNHHVVVVCPSFSFSVAVSAVVSHMLPTYPNIRFWLMVGIGGRGPTRSDDIRLGDVLVSRPAAPSPGIVQYHDGKTLHLTRLPNRPLEILERAVSQMESRYRNGERWIGDITAHALQRYPQSIEKWARPEQDWPLKSADNHDGQGNSNCSACDPHQRADHPRRPTNEPYIHYDLIASGDLVIRDARARELIAQGLNNFPFVTEATGVSAQLPGIAIRGICDYCDSHKHREWQGYASLTAAAYAKALLSIIPVMTVGKQPQQDAMELLLVQEGGQVRTTEPAIKIAAGTEINGDKSMTLLLEQRTDHQTRITEEDLGNAALGNEESGEEIMALLFDRRRDQIQITEDVVKAAAENGRSGREIMELLSNRCHDLSSAFAETGTGSLPTASLFDKDNQSRAVYSSTDATSQALSKKKETCFPEGQISEIESGYSHPENAVRGEQDDSDAETTYSVDSDADENPNNYIDLFAYQLLRDIKGASGLSDASELPSSYLESVLTAFAWHLHGESSTPFQWEVSVILRRMRERIMEVISGSDRFNHGEREEEEEEEVENDAHERFEKPLADIKKWLESTEAPDIDHEVAPLPPGPARGPDLRLLHDYDRFIRGSDAYSWLLCKIHQHRQLTFPMPSPMCDISAKTLKLLRKQKPLHRISRRNPSVVKMTFNLDWNPVEFVRGAGDMSSALVVDKFLCLTGSLEEAQIMTVHDYMDQTWPVIGKYTIRLLQELLVTPQGQTCSFRFPESKSTQISAVIRLPSSCFITVTGGPYIISEIAEQLGWLSSVLRTPPISHNSVALCRPEVEDLVLTFENQDFWGLMVVGSCHIISKFRLDDQVPNQSEGFCWAPFFSNAIVVSGYPILRRPEPKLGLEMSLATMAHLTGSQQVVQWGDRFIMKGFGLLLIATLMTSNVIVWHLFVSGNPTERISYIDDRLDTVGIMEKGVVSLRDLEGSRHMIGWCEKVTDFTGHRDASYNISTSGLSRPPASLVIDRLYLEAGAQAVGGFNMGINKKSRPFWLARENDYPSLLGWVSVQPIVFYDVLDRRAWLSDGISALLHLVRASLYLDENDPESPYDWVFDARQLKDTWEGFTGRIAALKTLKDWSNLNLKVYVKSKTDTEGEEYSKLEERVKKILHSVEILVDAQAQAASQDGIKVAQTLDFHKGLIGFDFLDVVKPLGPIIPRIQRLDSFRQGWADLVPSIGVTTIFGSGFGDVIRPDNPETVCGNWKSVPTGQDLMAVSISTLKMLHTKRLRRMDPDLGIGELTKKLMWAAPYPPFTMCHCLKSQDSACESHSDPVQYLSSKSRWKHGGFPKGSTPINLSQLADGGAVVFGHPALPGQTKREGAIASHHASEKKTSSGIEGLDGASSTSSTATRSAQSTDVTVPSLASSGAETPNDSNLQTKGKGEGLAQRIMNRMGRGRFSKR